MFSPHDKVMLLDAFVQQVRMHVHIEVEGLRVGEAAG